VLKTFVWLSFLIAGIFGATKAMAYVNPPEIFPLNPVPGQIVSIKITAGYCDGFRDEINEAPVTQNGNNLTISLRSSHYSESFCIFPPSFTYTFHVGAFPSGNYQLTVIRHYETLAGDEVLETLGVLLFVVSGSFDTSDSIPALSHFSELLLLFGLLMVGVIAIRFRSALPQIALVILPFLVAPVVKAQQQKYIEILLSTKNGAPTPQQIVNSYAPSGGTPLLQSLSVENPSGADYLLPIRAFSRFSHLFTSEP
jgi:hypothetical protein